MKDEDRRLGGRTISRFDSGQRYYHQPQTDEAKDEWDEWTGDKKQGPMRAFWWSFLHTMGTVVLGVIILVVLFFGISFFWKLVFPMIGK